MNFPLVKSPFYFLRHGQTNHNLNSHLYNENTEIGLNEKGISQALEIQTILSSISISTVCCSPLFRAQQTKEIVLKNKEYKSIDLEDFRECSSNLWKLFLASEKRSLTERESNLVQGFVNQVENGLKHAFQQEQPLLLIAHGGTYWALSQLLQLKGNRKIDNCLLVEVFSTQNGWKTKYISQRSIT